MTDPTQPPMRMLRYPGKDFLDVCQALLDSGESFQIQLAHEDARTLAEVIYFELEQECATSRMQRWKAAIMCCYRGFQVMELMAVYLLARTGNVKMGEIEGDRSVITVQSARNNASSSG